MKQFGAASELYKFLTDILVGSFSVGIIIDKIRKSSKTGSIRVLSGKFCCNAKSLLFREVHYVLPRIRPRIEVMSYKQFIHKNTTAAACTLNRYQPHHDLRRYSSIRAIR